MRARSLSAIAIAGAALAIVVAVLLLVVQPWQSGNSSARTDVSADANDSNLSMPPLVNDTTHMLDDAGPGAPVVVEFLDFECEVCGAVYPTMEELREQYAGEVSFAVRYFPLPGHFNSGNAAVAVEAASQQGQFEAMYQRMFETLPEWGEGRESEAERFRGYAEDLGLDMRAFDSAVADPATLARVEADFQDGIALGVTGTPAIFIDGERLELSTLEDIEAGIERALQ